jgi:hypothetical protein
VKTRRSAWRVFLILCALSTSALVLAGQTASSGYVESNGKRLEATPTYEGTISSYTRRGNEPFTVGYFIKDGNLIRKNSLLGDQDGPVTKLDLNIKAVGEAFDAVVATGKGTDLTLTGSISASDDGDGKKASDFSGLGTQIFAADYAKVNIDNMKIDTKGFVRAAFIADTHAQIFVNNSQVTVLGANPLTQAYKGYKNSADQNIMMSPPWVLGIQGGARAANMLGDKPTLSVVNTSVTSGGWAILSTDGGNDFVMNVVDSNLRILPESEGGMSSGKFSYSSKYGTGYGTYMIGNAVQNFYGVTFGGTTFAAIMTGGDATYRSSNGSITLKDAEGKEIKTITGAGKPTTINSVFGFMTHGDGIIRVLDGTVVNSEGSTFLHKNGTVSFVADNAVLNPASGILLQMIDNDDSTVGGSMSGFNTEFKEAAGWPSENGNVTKPGEKKVGGQGGPGGAASGPGGGAASGPGGGAAGGPGGAAEAGGAAGGPGGGQAGGPSGAAGGPGGAAAGPGGGAAGNKAGGQTAVKFNLTNGNYKGDVFNGSGYYTQSAKTLDVTIGKGANLTGAICLTETRHVDETGKQNTHFTINEYYYLGHVVNRPYRNGSATIAVTLSEGGTWNVTGESQISKLVLGGGKVEGANGAKVVMTVDGKQKPIKAGETYSGKIVISPAK